MKKGQALAESVLLFGILYLIYEIMYFGYVFVIRYGIGKGWDFLDVEGYGGMDVTAMSLRYMAEHPVEYTVLSWFLILGLIALVAIVTKGHLMKDMAFRWLGPGPFLASLVVGLGLIFALNGVVILFGEATAYHIRYIPLQIFKSYDMPYLLVTAGVITPICEELFFRGLVQGRLAKAFGPAISVLGAALIFAVSHLNIVQGIFVLPVGILCGMLVVRTGSVLSAIWLHILYNVVNIYLAKMPLFQYNSLQLLIMVVFGFGLMAFGLRQLAHPRAA